MIIVPTGASPALGPQSPVVLSIGRHCAWCGDPGDEYGSHGICQFHAEQQRAKIAARRQLQLQQKEARR